jgi:hypothetical protein
MDPLTRSLLLGLDQAPAGHSGLPTDELVEHADPALAALLRAGSAAVFREAAAQTVLGIPRPEPAPVDPRPPLPEAAVPLLLESLRRRRQPQLRALVAIAAERGMRLPARTLPAVLDTRDEERRGLLRPLLGPQAAWLAAQRREHWGWVLRDGQGPTDSDPVWVQLYEEGETAVRVQALRALRRADPQGALERLALGFASEPAKERAELLPALQQGLGPGDEDFLEARLSDRSKHVRKAAADLLAVLPGSALSQRTWHRGRALLRLEDGQLVVDLPPEIQPADEKRDGIEASPLAGMGPRLSRAARILGRVDPARWPAQLGLDPRRLLDATASDEDLAAAVGFTLAALRFRADAWYGPLYAWWTACPPSLEPPAQRYRSLLVAALPAAEVEVLLRLALERNQQDAASTAMLERLPRPWSEPVARAVLAHVAAHSQVRRLHPWLRQDLSMLAWALPLSLLPEHLDLQGAEHLFEHLAARRRLHAIFPEG